MLLDAASIGIGIVIGIAVGPVAVMPRGPNRHRYTVIAAACHYRVDRRVGAASSDFVKIGGVQIGGVVTYLL